MTNSCRASSFFSPSRVSCACSAAEIIGRPSVVAVTELAALSTRRGKIIATASTKTTAPNKTKHTSGAKPAKAAGAASPLAVSNEMPSRPAELAFCASSTPPSHSLASPGTVGGPSFRTEFVTEPEVRRKSARRAMRFLAIFWYIDNASYAKHSIPPLLFSAQAAP